MSEALDCSQGHSRRYVSYMNSSKKLFWSGWECRRCGKEEDMTRSHFDYSNSLDRAGWPVRLLFFAGVLTFGATFSVGMGYPWWHGFSAAAVAIMFVLAVVGNEHPEEVDWE